MRSLPVSVSDAGDLFKISCDHAFGQSVYLPRGDLPIQPPDALLVGLAPNGAGQQNSPMEPTSTRPLRDRPADSSKLGFELRCSIELTGS